MPGMVVFRRRWSVGSDDLVLPALFLFLLHAVWLVVLSVVLFGISYGPGQSCSLTLVDHGRGYLGILVSCLICEGAIIWLSMRGSILYTEPRESMQYVLYIRLAILLVELVYAIVGIGWLVQYYGPCDDVTAKNVTLGIVACNWLVIFSMCFTLMCTFDPTGRTIVKLRATKRKQRNLRTYNLRHRLEEGQASSWTRRLKVFMCCSRAQDSQSDAYSEIANLFAEFFRDLDIVPSDIIAGLVLLRQQQRAKRSAVLDEGNNDILAFLSGMPVTRSTKYLNLKNSEMAMYKEVCYYMLFALAAYGWPMYLMRKPACGLCRLVSSCPCLSLSQPRFSPGVTVEDDNCCSCNVIAIKRHFLDENLAGVEIVYTSCHDAVYETPFFVAVDHEKKKVVISIRGTLSPKDALTDLTGDAERLPVEEQHGTWLGHKGMVLSAEYIKKKLEQEMILSQAFGRDLGRGTKHYGLVVVGHSLGAGTAAILSFLLRPAYPSLQCYSYSPPGGLLSEDAMEYSKEFVTSVVLGKDLVPRIGLSQLEGFRRHLLEVLQKSNKPKWRVIVGGTKCIPKSELLNDDLSVTSVPNSRLWTHPSDLTIALSASTPLYPPGRVIHVVHNHPPESCCCGQEEPTYSAIWGDNKAFDEVIISPAMLHEHMPHIVMNGLNKVLENYNLGKTALLSAAKIMVSPTEMDLNLETLYQDQGPPPGPPQEQPPAQPRRSSSIRSCARSEISLEGFSEAASPLRPPPCLRDPVSALLRGARERLAGELRERRAPLAVMESLSDNESLYSLDSRRSSAAFRGSPSLGPLPERHEGPCFYIDPPIPEENPSLSSRTELLAADQPDTALALYNQAYSPTGSSQPGALFNQGYSPPHPAGAGSLFNPSPPRKQEAAHSRRYHSTPSHSSHSPPSHQRASSEGVESGRFSQSSASPGAKLLNGRPPSSSSGAPSPALLEFAEFIDGLFNLDSRHGSLGDVFQLSEEEEEEEEESGRGSDPQNQDSQQQILARAQFEPNLVPKPPRTFASSADPSSGISLSPSLPLSSSGEAMDLSPGDPPLPHPLRTHPSQEDLVLSAL
ncbi:diacylglycerol lipase-alpha isoform X2 [Acipenser ruthenus]|uniref:diacylglycerol lipase-alpha isoform X2 n=1 Tax=Acipenser ruthenus TaxID=7906 RepID=UPI0027406EA0|nr:diacylglycerol lipase-alpha isoform X2 [Acipenser ruthenus]